jgi:hypothetical protein
MKEWLIRGVASLKGGLPRSILLSVHLKFDLIRGVAFAWSGFTRGRLIYSIYNPGHTWQLYLKLKENILMYIMY